ncbi:MAG: four-carbon acid sugar kinase family protein [Paracoccaceae bacterium]
MAQIRRFIALPSPKTGVRLSGGYLFVEQQPLSESPMKDRPLTPMRDSNLMRLLAPQVKSPVGLADCATSAQGAPALRAKFDALKVDGIAHIAVDVVANEDLSIIAQVCRDWPFLTGESAIAMWLTDQELNYAPSSMQRQTHAAKRLRKKSLGAARAAIFRSSMTQWRIQIYRAVAMRTNRSLSR